MIKWWNWILISTLVYIFFLAIPILYSGDDDRSEAGLKKAFEDFIKNFNKTYKSNATEYEIRYQHFVTSIKEIDYLNAKSFGPEEHKARYGITKYSDMSKNEFIDIHLSDEKYKSHPNSYGHSWRKQKKPTEVNYKYKYSKEEVYSRKKRASVPLNIDWRSNGLVGPVRNQGLCGACWAFSTIGTMETMAAIKAGKFQPLSVQEVIDCAGLGNNGCSGGDICLLLSWMQITKVAIQPEKEYPLQLMNGDCKLQKNATGVQVKSFTCDDFSNDEDKILEALSNHGPVAVAVNALTWQNYLGGVIQYHCSGAVADLNHAVELVGYDLTADVPYYIAKNSWGPEFGNGGYLKLSVGNNICGLANEVATVDV